MIPTLFSVAAACAPTEKPAIQAGTELRHESQAGMSSPATPLGVVRPWTCSGDLVNRLALSGGWGGADQGSLLGPSESALGSGGEFDATVASALRRDVVAPDMLMLIDVIDIANARAPASVNVVPLGSDGLLDNFGDGDDTGWTHLGITSVPPTWEVVGGRYRLSLGAPAWMQSLEYMISRWNDSVVNPDTYRHGRVRMRFSLFQPGTDVFVLVRGTTPAFGVQFWNDQARLTIGNLFNITVASVPVFAAVPVPMSVGTDYFMEARFVGAELSLKFWPASEPEPATPQLIAEDPRWWQSTARGGLIELFVLDWWRTGQIGAEFDDIYFYGEAGPLSPVIDPDNIPASGVPVPGLEVFDDIMRNRMAAGDVPAGALAVMRNGVVVYDRGFGWKDRDRTQVLPHNAMMRLASVTKPFTAAAIRTLIDAGTVSLTSRAFDVGQPGGGLLDIAPFPTLGDARIGNITVEHLLQHRAGWNRNIVGDFGGSDYAAAAAMELPMPVSRTERMRFILGQPLQFTPGTQTQYSNVGYDALGLIVEEVTGLSFEEYLQEEVLDPLGISPDDLMQGHTRWEDRNPREPFYDAQFSSPSVFDPNGVWVQQPYGDWNHESLESFGGLISAASPVLSLLNERVVSGYDIGLPRPPNEPSSYKASHFGGMPGTSAVAAQRGDGVSFVALFNTVLPGQPAFDVYSDLNVILDAGVVTWPEPPPVPAVSEWGLIVMTLLVITAGTVVLISRRAGIAQLTEPLHFCRGTEWTGPWLSRY